jgi:hypothetical protein
MVLGKFRYENEKHHGRVDPRQPLDGFLLLAEPAARCMAGATTRSATLGVWVTPGSSPAVFSAGAFPNLRRETEGGGRKEEMSAFAAPQPAPKAASRPSFRLLHQMKTKHENHARRENRKVPKNDGIEGRVSTIMTSR